MLGELLEKTLGELIRINFWMDVAILFKLWPVYLFLVGAGVYALIYTRRKK